MVSIEAILPPHLLSNRFADAGTLGKYNTCRDCVVEDSNPSFIHSYFSFSLSLMPTLFKLSFGASQANSSAVINAI